MTADNLEGSPFSGAGHRRVWARLRLAGLGSTRRRVPRLMREHGLLSPRRVRQGAGISHDGRVTSDTPDVMWGTDDTRVLTAEGRMCWVFVAVGRGLSVRMDHRT